MTPKAKTVKPAGRSVAKLRKVAGLADQMQVQNLAFREAFVDIQRLIRQHFGVDLLPDSERGSYLGVAYQRADEMIRQPTVP